MLGTIRWFRDIHMASSKMQSSTLINKNNTNTREDANFLSIELIVSTVLNTLNPLIDGLNTLWYNYKTILYTAFS